MDKANYSSLDLIKTGGFGEIYRAIQEKQGIKRLVILKTIKKKFITSKKVQDQFEDELRVTFPLSHPNIGQILDYYENENKVFFVMEYIQGKTVRELQKKASKVNKQMTIPQVLFLILESAKALDYAHNYIDPFSNRKSPIIHRDISPQNIMITFNGRVKVIDCGVAKAKTNINVTSEGEYKGKPAYMPPEYINGKYYDHRFDQFSLGVIFWELITNKKLFTGRNYVEVLKKIDKCEIPLPRFHNQDIDHELQEVILKMLNPNYRKRFANLEEVQKILHRTLYTLSPSFTGGVFQEFVQSTFKSEILWEKAKLKNLMSQNN